MNRLAVVEPAAQVTAVPAAAQRPIPSERHWDPRLY